MLRKTAGTRRTDRHTARVNNEPNDAGKACQHPPPTNDRTHLVAHVERERHHAEVVDDEDSLEVEGFAVLHDPRPQRLDEVNVHHDDEGLGERRRHEEPARRPSVCNTRRSAGFERSTGGRAPEDFKLQERTEKTS